MKPFEISVNNYEKYIPYKFLDIINTNKTHVFCRNTKNGDFREFFLDSKKWIIIDPFRYEDEEIDSLKEMLKKMFKTPSVYHQKEMDRFLISDYDLTDVDEDKFKSFHVIPDNYRTKIIMQKKRFYNIFLEDGTWTDDRGTGYEKIDDYHVFIIYDKKSKIWFYKQVKDKSFQIIKPETLEYFEENVDTIFSSETRDFFEESFDFKIPSKVDYVYLSSYHLTGEKENDPIFSKIDTEKNVTSWYEKNIHSAYMMSFLSSRNISDIYSKTEAEFKEMSNEIAISFDYSLCDDRYALRHNRYYSHVGKYHDTFVYSIGDILIALMARSTCHTTKYVAENLNLISDWSSVIWNFFCLESLNPEKFFLPDSAVYMDKNILVTTKKLEGVELSKKYEIFIVVGDNSYICFDKNKKKTFLYGCNKLCNPLFESARKSLENYVVCKAYRYSHDLQAISEIVVKDINSLKIVTQITDENYGIYSSFLKNERDTTIDLWLGNNKLSPIFNDDVVERSSEYIKNLLEKIDEI